LRRGAASDALSRTRTHDHVDWAGLPVNLDLAFSPQQCDKVYRQHLMRKRWAQLWPWLPDTAHLCVCEASTEHGHDHDDAEKLGITN
jgi:sulfite reductase alpha subunit-like flavoprotein